MTLLSVRRLDVALQGRPVLRDVSFDLSSGELVGLIGPNGAGKSSLLRAVMGLLPAKGEISIGGQDARQLSASQRALNMAYVAQSRDVAWPLTVDTLVALGRSPHLGPFAPLAAADATAVDTALRRMDVDALRHRRSTELSGGELARVLVARALAQETPLLLADEPTAGLDPAHQIGLMQLFAELAVHGRSIIASTHDLGLAARFCTRLILLCQGRLIADGPPEAVVTAENLRSVYGVEAFFDRTDGGMVVLPTGLAKDPGAVS